MAILPANPTAVAAPTNKLTPNLTDQQLKENITAMQKQGVKNDQVQSYVNNYAKSGTGYSLKTASPTLPPSVSPFNPNTLNSQFINPNKPVAGTTTASKFVGSLAKGVLQAGQNIVNIPKNIVNTFKQGGQNIISDVQNTPQVAESAGGGFLGNTLAGVATAGHIAGTVGATAGGIIGNVVAPVIPEPIQKGLSAATDYVSEKASQIPGMTPEIHKSLGDIVNTAQLLGGEKVAPSADTVKTGFKAVGQDITAGTNKVVDTAGKVMEKITVPKEIEPLDANKVTDLYNRAIRPTVAGKSTAGQIAKANTNVISGLSAIAENKASFSFTDANGEITAGAAPKTVDQLTQSIAQTKNSIFKQYDALAKQAGEKGVSVNAPSIAIELQPVINSKSLAIANPSAVEYAKALQIRLNDAGAIDAQTAQDVIQHYNDSLKAFYRNPSYETASSASIDALIANKFRVALDDGIINATGEQYQALKTKYGALSAMEKDVAHRNIVWGRQNPVGLVSGLSNIGSGVELVRFLVGLHPADLAASITLKGIQKYVAYLNNPDVGVAKIFSEIERASQPATKNKLPPLKLKPK